MRILCLVLLTVSPTLFALPKIVAPQLSEPAAQEIGKILAYPVLGVDRAAAERRYAELTRKQLVSDLMALYDPANESKLRITYVDFIPESRPRGGADRGYGFHVVKRLVLGGRTIEVNEAWPEDKATGGLLPPNEIRVKSQVFDGPRRVEGSEKLYLFQVIRLAWGIGNMETAVFFRTRYAGLDEKRHNRQYSMRVPVSAPYSCTGCHAPDSDLYERFSAPGEKRNYEAIVQDSHFALPLSKTIGYREYVDYLKNERGVSSEFLTHVQKRLADGREAMRLPALRAALKDGGSIGWIEGDDGDLEYEASRLGRQTYSERQGVYVDRAGRLRLDALEEASEGVFEGKYRYWTPTPVVP